METFVCAQRGCEFDAESAPEDCPVCNNPFIANDAEPGGDGEAPWSDYTVAELREYVVDWGIDVDGSISRVPKEVLIAALELFEAEHREDLEADNGE